MQQLLREMHTWMTAYMKSFYTADKEVMQGILIKETHTGYVTANMVALAKHLGLDAHGRQLAEIMGLFHDCPLNTSDAADEKRGVDHVGRRAR